MKTDIILDIETTSLEPWTENARITVIGLNHNECYNALIDDNEKVILKHLAILLEVIKDYRIITFNGSNFDIPYILARAIKHNIKLPDIRGKHIDLRKLLSNGNGYKKGKLNDFASLIGEKKLENCDSATAVRLWKENRKKELVLYCLQDIRITKKITERLKQIGWL